MRQSLTTCDGKQGATAVRVSSSVVERPVLVGLRRTTILIPASYEEPEASIEVCRLSLLHELAHAAESDAGFGTIASLAHSVWFFLPHIWWMRSQLMMDQEFIADHTASQRYGAPQDYAASLLSLADSRGIRRYEPAASPHSNLGDNQKTPCAITAFSADAHAPALPIPGRAQSATSMVLVLEVCCARGLARISLRLYPLATCACARARFRRRGRRRSRIVPRGGICRRARSCTIPPATGCRIAHAARAFLPLRPARRCSLEHCRIGQDPHCRTSARDRSIAQTLG